MSKLQELINELCPNGVSYKKLNSVCEQFGGMTGVTNKWANEGNCKFIDYLNAYNNLKIDTTKLPYATVKNSKQNILRVGDILCTSASETPDECALSSVIENELPDGIFMDDHLFGIRIKDKNLLNPTFLNYYFRSKEFRLKVNKAVRGVTRYYISNPDFMKLSIPIPPLPVQEEIVRILDKMTDYVTELKAELKARKLQYEYYRNYLLTEGVEAMCPNGVEYKRVEEVFSISRGEVISKQYIKEHHGEFPVYSSQTENNGELGKIDIYKYDGEYLTWTTDGANAGTVFYRKGKFNVTNVCGILKTLDRSVMSKFAYYTLFVEAPKYVNKGMGNPKLMSNVMGRIKILVPPLSVQEEIVNKLDKYGALCNDITSGLPAEIEARQKQYEYYRDKLLNFKEMVTE